MKKNPHWPHAPGTASPVAVRTSSPAGTYKKEHVFCEPKRLDVLHRGLLAVAYEFGWQLEAWAVFPNHYHFVGHSPEVCDDAESLSGMLSKLHEKTAKWTNDLDRANGRQVWHDLWGNETDLQEILPRSFELRSSKSCKAWLGLCRKSIPVVFGCLV